MRPQLILVVLALVFGFVACGDDAAPVSPVVPSYYGPPKSLVVTGDPSFTFIGQTHQFTATATFQNGTVRNVTKQAQWSSTNPGVATVTEGLVRVESFGDTQISATFRDVTSAVSSVTARAPAVPEVPASIAIAGPAEIAPGSVTQFTATGRYADGSTRDITSTATWGSDDASMLRHSAGGRFDALRAGETRATARLGNRFASAAVLIQPAGTFKLTGTIRDTFGVLDGADVEVVSGTAATTKTTSRYDGKYSLYGVLGDIRVRASAPGYAPQELTATVSGPAVRDFTLQTASPTVEVSGQWMLAISTSSACSNSWPSAARRLEVASTITRNGNRFEIRFSGPNVVSAYPSQGRIAGSAFSMTLYFDYYYYYGISGLLQRLSSTEWLRITGTFLGTAEPSVITGNLSGTFNYATSSPTATLPGQFSSCSADGPFELRRQ